MTPRSVLDVSGLPRGVIGKSSITWWATLGFMVIEGIALAVCVAAYFYLRKNHPAWPPPPTPPPDLLVPTLNMILLVITILPMMWVERASKAMDIGKIRTGLLITVALSLLITILRGFEFAALNTRWDDHAYGSIVWATLGFHSALLLVDLLETGALAVLMYTGPIEEKHYGDTLDAAHYQYFLALSYVPLYVLLFLGPRFL